jgi:hypothetical protein
VWVVAQFNYNNTHLPELQDVGAFNG